MGLLDNVINAVCPAAGVVRKLAEENPEATKKVVKGATKVAKAALGVAAGNVKFASRVAVETSPVTQVYRAGKAVAEHPKETKEFLKAAGSSGLFGLSGLLFSAIA